MTTSFLAAELLQCGCRSRSSNLYTHIRFPLALLNDLALLCVARLDSVLKRIFWTFNNVIIIMLRERTSCDVDDVRSSRPYVKEIVSLRVKVAVSGGVLRHVEADKRGCTQHHAVMLKHKQSWRG